MVNFICNGCGKSFDKKSTYKYHINPGRKRACIQNKYENEQKMENEEQNMLLNPNESKIKKNESKLNPKLNPNESNTKNLIYTKNTKVNKDVKIVRNGTLINSAFDDLRKELDFKKHKIKNSKKQNLNNFPCKFCGKEFTTSSNRSKHMKKVCRTNNYDIINSDENKKLIKSSNIDENKDKIYMALIEEVRELKEEVRSMKNERTNINNGQIVQGGNVTNNNNSNNIVNNTILVAHGKEDLSRIDPQLIINAMRKGYKSVPELVQSIHFNKDYPEYQNAYIPSIKDSKAMVFNGERWMLRDKNEFIDYLYENKLGFLEDKFDEFFDKLSEISQGRFRRFINDIQDPDDVNIEKKIKNNIGMLMYNYKHMPKSTNMKYIS